MKLRVIGLALAASAFAFSAQAQTVVVKERASPSVTVRATTGTAVRHCVNRKVTTVNAAGVKVVKTVRRCD